MINFNGPKVGEEEEEVKDGEGQEEATEETTKEKGAGQLVD